MYSDAHFRALRIVWCACLIDLLIRALVDVWPTPCDNVLARSYQSQVDTHTLRPGTVRRLSVAGSPPGVLVWPALVSRTHGIYHW